jgi:hypothetical protein
VRQLLSALAASLLAAVTCKAADLYRVAGAVVNAQTGSALPHAEVYVLHTVNSPTVAKLTTGDDGRFSFDLPEGGYTLRAGTRTTGYLYGERNPDVQVGSAVIVGPGHDTANLIFRWYPTAAIFGRVLDDSGEPVEGALVQLVRSSITGGRRITNTARFERTNDLGEYRFGWIPGGARYYVAVTGKPWYAEREGATHSADHLPAFIPAYYPNTADVAHAQPLLPMMGEEVRADFTLTSAIGATVSVKHDAPSGTQGTLSLMSEGIAGTDGFQETAALPELPAGFAGAEIFDPKFVGVPPGHYTVQVAVRNGSMDFAGRRTIDVNGSDITVEIAVHPFATVSGTVHFTNPGAKPPASMVETLVSEGNKGVIGSQVRADGSFVFPSVPTGKYRPGIRGAPGLFTAGVEVRGVGFRDGTLELSEGDSATISIVASDETGRLRGFVMNGDQPAEAVLAVLAPMESGAVRAIYRGYQTESDGSFDFRDIPAGRYLLFAVDDTAFEYANPAAVSPYLADAKSVTIETRGTSTERISISGAKAK